LHQIAYVGVNEYVYSPSWQKQHSKKRNKKLSYCCGSMQYDRLKQLLRDIYFNAIHCDRSVSTCE